jgi:ferredoxin
LATILNQDYTKDIPRPTTTELIQAMLVKVKFSPDNIVVDAEAGEPLLNVAKRAGVSIPTGCLSGSCFACEVAMADQPVRACITGVPSQAEVTIALYEDTLW